MGPTPLILDVDTGVDDMVALLYAAASPEVELIAATTVTGNVHVDTTTRNTLSVLELAGLGDVEVARGADRPLVQAWEAFPMVHGEEGLGGFTPSAPAAAPSARDAPTLIVEEARRRPGDVLLVATGPLTNVALAVEREPALPELLGGFGLMGGAFREGGNVSPRAEANVWMDPEAAARVFTAFSGAAPAELPRCVGLEVTEQVVMTPDDVCAACAPAPDSPLARLIREGVGHYIDFYAGTGRFAGACMHDPLALAAMIDPALCGWAETRVEVELEGRWTRGETVTDLFEIRRSAWSEWPSEANAVVATSVDGDAVVRRIVERLASLVEARA
jgi:purine nucleosidase